MISKKTKYGLKALIHLAKKEDSVPTQISTISKTENISHKFLESILSTLRKAGYLGSKKGVKGGYYVIKNPKDISIAAIYRILEGPIAPLPCVSLNFYEKCSDCPDEESCNVHKLMLEIRDASLSVMENKTLQDYLY